MLDTVILNIPQEDYAISNPFKFKPPAKGLIDNSEGHFKYINNRTAEDRERGIYKPRLTINKRGCRFDLKVEFSAPKLLLGSNLDELEESDFGAVVGKLKIMMASMGVDVLPDAIENAKVSVFHPSKNIPLTGGYTATFAIRELSKINLSKKFDLERVKYRNDGHLLHLYSRVHSVVLYDKINDMGKPEKRAVDKEQTSQQTTIFHEIKEDKKKIEVLRFEVRLADKKKTNEVLEKIGYNPSPAFKDIFKKDICQKIANLYWEMFWENENWFLFEMADDPQDLLQRILLSCPKTKVKQMIYLVGLRALCRDDGGIRGLRTMLSGGKPGIKWANIGRDLKKIEEAKSGCQLYGFIDDIRSNLKEFKAFRYENGPKVVHLPCKEL
jgi:hypothetical protein